MLAAIVGPNAMLAFAFVAVLLVILAWGRLWPIFLYSNHAARQRQWRPLRGRRGR
jgi:hypothetical protein